MSAPSQPPTTPLFAIVVPTMNVAPTVRACLDSIADQSCQDFELIVVDGGSSDATVDIAATYAARLGGRLTVHSEPDQGPYDAMNRGVAMARGQWMFFLGADDTLHEPQTLNRVADSIGSQDYADLVYGDVLLRSNGSRYAGVFDLDRLQFHQNIPHQGLFYRRHLFATIGPYNLRYRIWADWDFNIRCFSNTTLVPRYVDLVIADYNDTSGLSKSADKEFRGRLPKYLWAPLVATARYRLGRLRAGRWAGLPGG